MLKEAGAINQYMPLTRKRQRPSSRDESLSPPTFDLAETFVPKQPIVENDGTFSSGPSAPVTVNEWDLHRVLLTGMRYLERDSGDQPIQSVFSTNVGGNAFPHQDPPTLATHNAADQSSDFPSGNDIFALWSDVPSAFSWWILYYVGSWSPLASYWWNFFLQSRRMGRVSRFCFSAVVRGTYQWYFFVSSLLYILSPSSKVMHVQYIPITMFFSYDWNPVNSAAQSVHAQATTEDKNISSPVLSLDSDLWAGNIAVVLVSTPRRRKISDTTLPVRGLSPRTYCSRVLIFTHHEECDIVRGNAPKNNDIAEVDSFAFQNTVVENVIFVFQDSRQIKPLVSPGRRTQRWTCGELFDSQEIRCAQNFTIFWASCKVDEYFFTNYISGTSFLSSNPSFTWRNGMCISSNGHRCSRGTGNHNQNGLIGVKETSARHVGLRLRISG